MLNPTCTITPLTNGFPTLQDTNIPGLTVLRSVKTNQVSRQQFFMGVARNFQRGGHTESYRGYSPGCHLNIVRYKKAYKEGRSHVP